MDLLTISEIEESPGISSPREKQLKDLSRKWVQNFRNLDGSNLEKLADLVGGEINDLDLKEDWTLSVEFFPGVKVHFVYYFHGEEFSNYGGKDSFKFCFSGENAEEVNGDDYFGLIEVTLRYCSNFLQEEEKRTGKDLEWKITGEDFGSKNEPIKYLETKDENELQKAADYLGGRYENVNSQPVLEKEIFQDLKISMKFEDKFNILFSGENMKWIIDYDLELLSMLSLNHLIRFITKTHQGENLPDICWEVFP